MTSPTIGDAKERRMVEWARKGWHGTVFYVDERRRRAKIALSYTGDVMYAPLDELSVCADEAPSVPPTKAAADALHPAQAG